MDEKEMNRSFYELVKKVRRNQKSYFATQDKKFLNEVLKPLEGELDRRLQAERPTLRTALQFRGAVYEMRRWQIIWASSFTTESRDNSIKNERNVDGWILRTEEYIKQQMSPTLQFES